MGGALSEPGTAGARARRILVVAGETSGDVHAARLVRALRALGSVELRGVAGPRLREAGVEAIVPQEDLAVIGFSGIVARLPSLFRARRTLLDEAVRWKPDVALLVDYPGFNLRLGPQLVARGTPVFYYIGPQVWAWHEERAAEMAKWVKRLAVVFPFEEPIFSRAGVRTTFVGHPLLDDLAPEVDEATLRAETGLGAGGRLVGLLPGSRAGELAHHLRPMLAAGRALRDAHADVRPVLALAEGRTLDGVSTHELEGISVVRGRTHAVQAFAACCAVASGTATLETALFGTPLVVCYHVNWLNYAIARRVVKLPHIGLPNIVAGREVAPELIQDAFAAAPLAKQLDAWLSDASALARQRDGLRVVRENLGGPGASARAAAALWECIA